jgi:hypothetical protein
MSKALYTPAIERMTETQIHRALACSGRHGTLKASLEDLQRAFGFSHLGPNGDGKVSMEWVFIDNQSRKLVNVYSYKGSGEAWGEWSIGGHAHPVAFEEWAKRQIAAYRRREKKMAALRAARAQAELDATLVAACG